MHLNMVNVYVSSHLTIESGTIECFTDHLPGALNKLPKMKDSPKATVDMLRHTVRST